MAKRKLTLQLTRDAHGKLVPRFVDDQGNVVPVSVKRPIDAPPPNMPGDGIVMNKAYGCGWRAMDMRTKQIIR